MDDELAAWLGLLLMPGLGRARARELLAACGSARAVLDDAHAHRLPGPAPDFARRLEATRCWLDGAAPGQTRAMLPLGHPQYPEGLLHTADPPLLLFVEGSVPQEGAWFAWPHSLAVVGSRSPSAQGRANAQHLAQELAGAGLCIVSGMALGIDAAAHEGALAARADKVPAVATIAVVGTGLDQTYPRQHANLAQRIRARGLLVSEYPLGSAPRAQHFPQRNRIIAGLGQGTLVVEAALRSGSLITARLAGEQGREVFAVPGSIHSPQAHGCHLLLRQGAKLVEGAADVLEELPRLPAPRLPQTRATTQTTKVPPPEDALLQALGFDPVALDMLLVRSGLDVATLQARLLDLELNGEVARLPGGRFQRLVRA